VDNFKDSIQHFQFCDPNTDYDKYCMFVKESDKKKATTTFIIMLLNRNVLKEEWILEMISFFKDILVAYIDTENRLNEVEELTEIYYILVSLGKNTLQSKKTMEWNQILETVELFSKIKVKEHKSISSRALFKMQDLLRILQK
jgi:hypothetical protein